ncbi:reverse transcriptase domain-containing protein [Nonomuraea sp. NPDC004354]
MIYDRATLLVAWERVAGNRGARTAGVDAVTRYYVEERLGVIPFLEDLRSLLKDGTFRALPVKQAVIPKENDAVRYLGIPMLRDRVVQMALKLILEPIFEVDFYPASHGYRPGRRAQDAIAEIRHFTCKPGAYEWVIEGDIKACFDNVDHHVLMDLVGELLKDRKVMRLVSAFLCAGVVELHGGLAETLTGTPQGGVISPLLANIYPSASTPPTSSPQTPPGCRHRSWPTSANPPTGPPVASSEKDNAKAHRPVCASRNSTATSPPAPSPASGAPRIPNWRRGTTRHERGRASAGSAGPDFTS